MAVAMDVTGDPSSQLAMLAVVVPATAGLAVLTWRLLRSHAGGAGEQLRAAVRYASRRPDGRDDVSRPAPGGIR